MMSILENHFSDTLLVAWLAAFPVTYTLHVAEECICGGGYSSYLFNKYNVELSPLRFLMLQTLGMSLMIISILVAVSFKFPYTMLVVLGSTVLVNGLVHLIRRFGDGPHEPGLITAALLWIPLGSFTLLSIRGSMTVGRLLFAASLGLAINVVVDLIAKHRFN